jgi:hypothetical protein
LRRGGRRHQARGSRKREPNETSEHRFLHFIRRVARGFKFMAPESRKASPD